MNSICPPSRTFWVGLPHRVVKPVSVVAPGITVLAMARRESRVAATSLFAPGGAAGGAAAEATGPAGDGSGLLPRPPLLLDPLPRDLADELTCVASWLDQHAPTLELVHSDGGLASDLAVIASFDPAPGPLLRRR